MLTSNLGLAYIAHYNAPAFYRSLEHRSEARFGQACLYACLLWSPHRPLTSQHASAPSLAQHASAHHGAPLPLPHRYAFGILTALYLGMMRLGYATFGVSLSTCMQVLTTAPPSLFPTGTRRLAT